MTRYHFHVGLLEQAESLVAKFHYSRRSPANVQCVGTWHADGGLFGDDGPPVAACFFSIPPTRWSEDVLELSRLVRDESVRPQLTGLISLTVKWLAKTRTADLLVSFADATHGHHGGVYQAASWNYDGQRDRQMDGLIVDGVFIAGRSCNSSWGTRSPSKLRERFPDKSIEPHFDQGKHLYWRSLCKAGDKKAATLGLKRAFYPKPNVLALAA